MPKQKIDREQGNSNDSSCYNPELTLTRASTNSASE